MAGDLNDEDEEDEDEDEEEDVKPAVVSAKKPVPKQVHIVPDSDDSDDDVE